MVWQTCLFHSAVIFLLFSLHIYHIERKIFYINEMIERSADLRITRQTQELKQILKAEVKSCESKTKQALTALNALTEDVVVILESIKYANETKYKDKDTEKCLDGWMPFMDHCYLFVYENMTWENAKVECQTKGGHLVKIDNNEEDTWLTSVIKDQLWIGMNDILTEGHWIWDFDNSAVTFNQWSPGEPNGGRSENCGHYCNERCLRSSFKWNDMSCSSLYGYVCEKSL